MTIEQEISGMKEEMTSVKESVDKLVDLVTEMNTGLYGNVKNGQLGIIARQQLLEQEILDLRKELALVKRQGEEQYIALEAKKNLGGKILEGVKWAALIFLVAKGIFDFDNLFGKFF